jgi:hypothetical protein
MVGDLVRVRRQSFSVPMGTLALIIDCFDGNRFDVQLLASYLPMEFRRRRYYGCDLIPETLDTMEVLDGT